jgi:hypothetical protein
MRSEDATQFSISIKTKSKLDMIRVINKDAIIKKYKKTRRLVSNDEVIRFLIDKYEGR